jgi:hypothetical protein
VVRTHRNRATNAIFDECTLTDGYDKEGSQHLGK